MAQYSFVTEWRIESPIADVWTAILDSLRWPEWWKGVRRVVELAPGDERGLGNIRRYTFRSALPYDLMFDMRLTQIEPPHVLIGTASGELQGEGRWRLTEAGPNATHVRYEWDVRTTQAWMNLLAPLARPVFAWNHDRIMRWGEEGLSRYLRTRPPGGRPRSS
jgi:uncharacterized protein YndB with AHSA1/START domain